MSVFDSLALRPGYHLSIVLQAEAAECGLACLTMIANYHGYCANMADLRQQFGVSLIGMNLTHMVHIAGRLRLGTRAVRLELDELQNLSLPCVLHWDLNHFVVLKALGRNGAVIHDPSVGRRAIKLDEVSRRFTGVALELWPSTEFERKEAKPGIKLLALMGRISGLRRSLIQILVMGAALQLFALLGPFLMQWTIDHVILSDDRHLLNTLVLAFAVLLLMQILIGSARSWTMMYMSTLFTVQWRTNVFSHMLRLPSQYFEKRHLGDVVSRFGSADQIQQTLTASFFSVILDGLMAVSTLALMFVYSPGLTCIAIGAMLLYALIRLAWYQPLRNATEEQIVHGAGLQSHFLETARGIRALKLFQKLDLRRSTWLGLFIGQLNAGLRAQKLQMYYQQINGFLFGIENLLVVWAGATLVMDGGFTVGMFMAFYAYKAQFNERVSCLIDSFFELRMLQLHGERLADIVLHPPEHDGSALVQDEVSDTRADIDVHGLAYRYSDQEPWILNELTFYIDEGERVAIIGPSGCGKSTLCKVLLGILPATKGSIRIGGFESSGAGLARLRQLSGCVMQDDVLFSGSLSQNICFFDAHPDMAWIAQCCQTAGIHDDIARMPMGYDTLVGDMGTVLSGGQKQRVLLARAIYKKPKILFLDEATSHLDMACEAHVNAAIRALNITCVIVAHRPETIASADRVIELANGRIVHDIRVRTSSPPAA